MTKKITYSKNELYPKNEYEKFYQEKLLLNSLLTKVIISGQNENFGFIYSQMDSIPYYNIPNDIYNKILNEESYYFGIINEDSVNNSLSNLIQSEKNPTNKYLNMSPVDEKTIGEDEKTSNNSANNININNNSRNHLIDNQTHTHSCFKDSLESTCYKRDNLNIFNQNLMSDLNSQNKTKSKINKKIEKKKLKNEFSYYYSPEKYSKDTIFSYSSSTNNITGTFKHDIVVDKKEKIYKPPQLIKNPLICNLNLKIRKDKIKEKKEKEKIINSSMKKYSFNTNTSITNNTKQICKNVSTINATDSSNVNKTNNLKYNSNRKVSKTSRNKRFASNSPEVTSMSNHFETRNRNRFRYFNPFANLNNSNNSIFKTKEIKRISSQIFRNKNKFKIKSNIRYKSPQDKINNSSMFYYKDRRFNNYTRDGDKTIG
jgi:hypothetical protein